MTGTISIYIATAGYILYFFLITEKGIRDRILSAAPQLRERLRFMLFQRGAGVLFMGVLPAIAVWICCPQLFAAMGIRAGAIVEHWPWFAGGMGLMYLLSSFGARQPDTQARYPEMQIPEWTGSLFGISAGAWVAYLAAYEFLFRGVLLFGCYEAFGMQAAIAINVSLYAFAHIWKGWRETLGSVVFGVLFSWATLHTGTVLLPFLAHCITSINTEYLCIRWRKDMVFLKRR